MPKRKIEAMYERYGHRPGAECRSCINLIRYAYKGAVYSKCTAYGSTRSEATDWKLSNEACGRYGKPLCAEELELLTELRHAPRTEPEPPAEGQIGFYEIEEGENE